MVEKEALVKDLMDMMKRLVEAAAGTAVMEINLLLEADPATLETLN